MAKRHFFESPPPHQPLAYFQPPFNALIPHPPRKDFSAHLFDLFGPAALPLVSKVLLRRAEISGAVVAALQLILAARGDDAAPTPQPARAGVTDGPVSFVTGGEKKAAKAAKKDARRKGKGGGLNATALLEEV